MATSEEQLHEWLRPEEVCALLRISRGHLLRLASNGTLSYLELGPQTRRFRRSDVEALVDPRP